MVRFVRDHLKYIILFIILAAAVASAFIFSGNGNPDILDEEAYTLLRETITSASETGGLADQDSLYTLITSWAEENGIKYKTDEAGNIIFTQNAAKRKKNVSSSVVCVSYDYKTAAQNADVLASAALIAGTKLDSGRKRVIFLNNEDNSGAGYKAIDKKYFKGKAKVLYLDQGSSAYLSRSSFGKNCSSIVIPASKEKTDCDTAVKVHITGVPSGTIGPDMADHPDPVSVFSLLLTRLKTKSVSFQLTDFDIGSAGDNYPVSLDVTFLMNSYSVSSFTGYIKKQIKSWENSYTDEEYQGISFTYEVIDDPEELPETAYTSDTSGMLTNILYTVKTGLYKYEEDDEIPEGHEGGDICGINCITDIRTEEDSLYIDLVSEAYNSDYMKRITGDNKAAAKLFKCSAEVNEKYPAFMNDKDALYRTFTKTFTRVKKSSGLSGGLKERSDDFFTPCSYISLLGKKADIIHLRLNPKKAVALTNTILLYIETKGNFFSFPG